MVLYNIKWHVILIAAANNINNVHGTIVTSTPLGTKGKPYCTVLNTSYMVWYNYAAIKLSTLLESLGNIGFIRNFDCALRLCINTGSINIPITSPNSTTPGYGVKAYNSFSNTCPVVCNYLCDLDTKGGITVATTNISFGVYFGKPPNTSLANAPVNLSTSGASHPLPSCSEFIIHVTLNPMKNIQYIEENCNKKVIFRRVSTTHTHTHILALLSTDINPLMEQYCCK